jgi:hypothetical protein
VLKSYQRTQKEKWFATYTKCVYKIVQRCEVIFYQDNEKNSSIAVAMELFFEEEWRKKNK